MATTEDMSQSSAADGIKMLPKSDLVGKNQESREKERKKLEKELQRKDKALAEAAALLVLTKKANAIWGDPEDGK